jgi:hypothetical protein
VALVAVDDLGGEYHLPGAGISLEVPKSISEAFSCPERDQWKNAVKEEMDAIQEAGTLSEPVKAPEGIRITGLKFIFTKKVGEDGKVNRFKARLVYNHSNKEESTENNYSPVANRISLRLFLAAVVDCQWHLVQADVKTAFLNADNPGLEYVRLPREVVPQEERVRILKKALYGLQRAPKMWHLTFSAWAKEENFNQNQHDPCLFIHAEKQQMVIIYVDDMLMAAGTSELLADLCERLMSKFKSRILGEPVYFLGMNVDWDKQKKRIVLSQKTYVEAIVEKYGLQTMLPRSLPTAPGVVMEKNLGVELNEPFKYGSLVGALMFIAVSTRPDIAFVVSALARYVSKPCEAHWKMALGVVAYLKGTKGYGIILGGAEGGVFGYADSDWGNDVDDRMSVSGGIIFWGESILSWHSRKQKMISLSTAEAESHALVDVAKEIVYIQRLVEDVTMAVGLQTWGIPTIYSDNQPAMDAVINGKGRTKHYDMRIKYLALGISERTFQIVKVATVDNLADIFTKVLHGRRFKMLAGAMVNAMANSA